MRVFQDANDVLQAQDMGRGEVLSARESQALYERQTRWLKQHAMLNRERTLIIEPIKREGMIYGSRDRQQDSIVLAARL